METLNIDEINIKNFVVHKDTTLRFADLTLITGGNGSGKTSILNAIGFGLTGGTKETRNRHILMKDIIRDGTEKCMVTLKGSLSLDIGKGLESRFMTLTRTRTSKALLSNLVFGEKEMENPSEIIERLVMAEDFDRLVYIDGHTLSLLLVSMTPADIGKMFDKLFGIDDLNDLIDRIKISAVDRRISEVEHQIATIKESIELSRSVRGLKDQVDELRNRRNHLEVSVSEKNEVINKKRRYLAALKADEEKWKSYDRARSQYESEIKTIKNLIQNKTVQKERLEQEISQIESAIKRQVNASNIETALKSVDKLASEIDSLDETIVTRIKQIAQEQAIPTVIDILIKKINEGKGKPIGCPVCGVTHEANSLTVEHLTNLKGASLRMQKILEQEVANLKSEKMLKKQVLESIKGMKETLQYKKDSLTNVLDDITKYTDRIVSIEKAQKLNEEQKPDNFSIELVNETETEIAVLENEVRTSQQLIRDIDQQLSRMDIINNANENDGTGASLAKDLEKLTQSLTKLQAFKNRLIRVRNGFSRVLKTTRFNFTKLLNEKLNGFLRVLSPSDYIRTISISITERRRQDREYYQYDVIVRTLNGEKRIENLSTGQKTLVMLSIIFALSEIQKLGVNFIILDEPDETIDEDVQEKLADILVRIAKMPRKVIVTTRNNQFKQMIIDKVNHHNVASFVVYNCELVNDDEGGGRVSVVKQVTA